MKPLSTARAHKRKASTLRADATSSSSKRRRTTSALLDAAQVHALGGPSQFNDSLQHPLGIQPLGNAYLYREAHGNGFGNALVRERGLGALASLFDDLVLLLLQFMAVPSLCRLAQCSKALYAFVDVDSLWKEICLDENLGDFQFLGSWRATVAHLSAGLSLSLSTPRVQASGIFSDTLYHAWYNAQVDPWRWAAPNTIPVRSNLSLDDFIRDYEIPNKPVVIRGVVDSWPAFKKWDRDYLLRTYGELGFKTDLQSSMKLADYFKYCSEAKDEAPIYLFDNLFGDRNPSMLADYVIPEYFREDYFDLIPGKDRPSFRWLLVGPPRSGATFHKDPNHTSAWNALLRGCKKWIMFHPDHAPAGVVPSLDGMDVSTPETLVQWFTDFYSQKHSSPALEFIQRPGDLVFIPSGWWHSVLNLEESIAVTQNFVSGRNLRNVYRFLKHKPSKELFNVFVENVRRVHPEILEQMEREVDAEEKPLESIAWTTLVNGEDGEDWTLSF